MSQKGVTRKLGRWLASKGREWLNSKLNPTKTQRMSAEEEAALQDSLIRDLTGQSGGHGMTMDEEEFKKFQAFQQARTQTSEADTLPATQKCDLHDPEELAVVLEGYYSMYNPEKVEAVGRIAAKWAKSPEKLAKALEERYPDSILADFCPKVYAGERDSLDGATLTEKAQLSAWASKPSLYTAAVAFIAMVTVILFTVKIPLKDLPAVVSRIDALALLLLALGAANLSAKTHEANACVLALGGAHFAWMMARNWHTRRPPGYNLVPASALRRPRRKDWYNY